MDYKSVLKLASEYLCNLSGSILDIVEVKKPSTVDYAIQLSRVISKLSPLIGNMIEISTIDLLNQYGWEGNGCWIRQDPEFPDALFKSDKIQPNPGIEIKAWFPLATEITARFKDSITIFDKNQINMALIAWLPEYVIYGTPKIIKVLVVSGKSVAAARDRHYNKPPKYIILEPEDTSKRKRNLQQTNTNGYKLQEDKSDIKEAQKIVDEWGEKLLYSPKEEYQRKLRELLSKFIYRLDTNYAKIDRIEHQGIEQFKMEVENTLFQGKTIKEWARLLSSHDKSALCIELQRLIL